MTANEVHGWNRRNAEAAIVIERDDRIIELPLSVNKYKENIFVSRDECISIFLKGKFGFRIHAYNSVSRGCT